MGQQLVYSAGMQPGAISPGMAPTASHQSADMMFAQVWAHQHPPQFVSGVYQPPLVYGTMGGHQYHQTAVATAAAAAASSQQYAPIYATSGHQAPGNQAAYQTQNSWDPAMSTNLSQSIADSAYSTNLAASAANNLNEKSNNSKS